MSSKRYSRQVLQDYGSYLHFQMPCSHMSPDSLRASRRFACTMAYYFMDPETSTAPKAIVRGVNPAKRKDEAAQCRAGRASRVSLAARLLTGSKERSSLYTALAALSSYKCCPLKSKSYGQPLHIFAYMTPALGATNALLRHIQCRPECCFSKLRSHVPEGPQKHGCAAVCPIASCVCTYSHLMLL